MRKTIFPFLILCCLFFQCPAQSSAQVQDSLQLLEEGRKLLEFVNESYLNLPYAQSIKTTEKALTIFQEINNIEGICDAYNYLSFFYYLKKDFNKSENYLLLAKDLTKKGLSIESVEYRTTWINLTTYLDFSGFKEEAIEDYKKIIILEKELGIGKPDEAQIFQNLGTAYLEIGEYEEAIDALKNAVRLRESIVYDEDGEEKKTNEINIAGVYSDLADCYKRKHENKKAISIFKNSLELLAKFDKKNEYINQIRYNCYYKLAEIYLKQEDNDLSLQYAKKASEIKNKYNLFDDCFSYQILGKIYLSQGEDKKALSNFDKAIKSATNESDGFANFPQIATAYSQKGNALLQLSLYDEALVAFQKGLQITALDFKEESILENPSMDQIVQKTGSLDLITGKAKAFLAKYKSDSKQETLSLAADHYLLATEMIDVIRKGYNTTASKHTLAQKANQIYEQAIESYFLLFQETKEAKYLEQAFVFAESNKAVTLLESMTKEMALGVSGIPDSLLDLERKLSIKLTFAESQLAENKSSKDTGSLEIINRFEQERFELKESYKRLISKIENEYPQYYQLKYDFNNATVKKIQEELLDNKTALVEYFVGEEYIYNFLISKNDFKVEKTKYDVTLINQINELNQILSTAPKSETFVNDFKTFTQITNDLYDSLLEKQIATIVSEVKNLIIIPDGILGALPFGILISEKPNLENVNYSVDNLSYLMEQFPISYNYSSTLFFNKQKVEKQKDNQTFIAFAPSFNDQIKVAERSCSDSGLSSLKCSSEEVNSINKNFDGRIIEGLTSTKDAFLKEVAGYNIVHLATHACVNEDNAMLHQIHFADDYVTPYDLYNLKLSADLVVLSACNTGAGKIVKGEGVMSLSRGFIQSGSASTLMSLWAVDDCATSDLMISFYDYLEKGYSKNEALQKTKIGYIKTASDKAKAHPYYWAAFTQYGDSRPIFSTSSFFNRFTWAALAVIFTIIIFVYIKKIKK